MISKVSKSITLMIGITAASLASTSNAQPAFEVLGKTYQVDEVAKRDQSAFYDIESKKFQLIERYAQSVYMEKYWEMYGEKNGGLSAEKAEEKYLKENVKVSEKDITETLDKFKDHPQLSKLSKEEQKKQVSDYLYDREKRAALQSIINVAFEKKEIAIKYPEPQEPVYKITLNKDDHIKYGPEDTDIKPVGCEGEKCPIVIVEYSEFQCPFCAKVLPDVKKLLTKYKGKIAWVARDFPLSFHNRAEPAAIAAKCAAKQGKYWQMYSKLFDNQRALEDADITKYGEALKLNMKNFDKCLKNSDEIKKQIQANMESGAQVGVTGTPAFFINGRRLSGAVPYPQFEAIVEDELKKM